MNFSNLKTRILGRYQLEMARYFGRRVADLRSKTPIISFTFDDFPVSALRTGGVILRQYGAVGTFYASFGLMNQDSAVGRIFNGGDIERLLADGHELGCHTFGHCHAWNTKPSAFEASILENRRALQQLVPGAVFKTHSYPIACPRPATKRRAARYFSGCRGGGMVYNAGATDLNNLSAFFLEKSRNDPDFVKSTIQSNRAAKGWLVFATHDVCENPTPFGCRPDVFETVVRWSVESGARILPAGVALEAMNLCAP